MSEKAYEMMQSEDFNWKEFQLDIIKKKHLSVQEFKCDICTVAIRMFHIANCLYDMGCPS